MMRKMDDIFESEQFKAFEKRYKEEREIRCPFCGELQVNDDGQYPVTYWGEPETTEMECQNCEKKFFVTENVSRTYEVSKEE
jgi:DNA-directed RNA polymerase subunit RPC12/RpoP